MVLSNFIGETIAHRFVRIVGDRSGKEASAIVDLSHRDVQIHGSISQDSKARAVIQPLSLVFNVDAEIIC